MNKAIGASAGSESQATSTNRETSKNEGGVRQRLDGFHQSAILDALTKRAEVEAAQYQVEATIGMTQEDDELSGKKKKPAAKITSPNKNILTSSPGGSTSTVGQSKARDTNESRRREDIAEIVAERSKMGVTELVEEVNLISVVEPEKSTKVSTGVENGKTKILESTSCDRQEQQEQQQQQQQQQQLSQPGALMGAPGQAFQRPKALRFSLVGRAVPDHHDDDPLFPTQRKKSTTTGPPVKCDAQSNTSKDTTMNHELAEATLVVEDPEEQKRPSADPVDLEQVKQRQEKRKRQKCWFTSFLVVALILVAVVIGKMIGMKKTKETVVATANRTPAPASYWSTETSRAPSSAPTVLLDLFSGANLPNKTVESLQVFGTPQWKAWRWLVNHQNITNLPEWRKVQLFAMATFFYSFEGENWFAPIKERWMDDKTDECYWFSSGFSYFHQGVYLEFEPRNLPCDNRGRLTNLQVEDLGLSGLSPMIPPEILLLTSLSSIGLGWNQITTSISALLPSEFYKMTSLSYLHVH